MESGLGGWQGIVIPWIVPCDNRKYEPAIVCGARHGPDLVHRIGNRHGAVPADAAQAGAQTADAAMRRRADDRASSVGTQGERGKSGRHHSAGPAGRTAGPALSVPRILRRTREGGVTTRIAQAADQFDHGCLPNQNRTSLGQPLDDGRIVVEYLLCKWPGSPGCWVASHREQIFGRIRYAVQRASVVPARDLPLGSARLFQREIACQSGVGVEGGSKALAALQITFGKFYRGECSLLQALAEFTNPPIESVFLHHGLWLPSMGMPDLSRVCGDNLEAVEARIGRGARFG